MHHLLGHQVVTSGPTLVLVKLQILLGESLCIYLKTFNSNILARMPGFQYQLLNCRTLGKLLTLSVPSSPHP